MQSDQISVSLSKLVPSKRDGRRVKPEREAHRRMVASITAFGLLEPLVVRPVGDNGSKRYQVIAGNRRLAALRAVHKDAKGDPKVECVLREADDETAGKLALAENFVREPMHPLDEAEAFAKLASVDGKDAGAIGAEFGVTQHYVRQRMKLATLAEPVKRAYRMNTIDTGIAEAFAAVPQERQLEVWQEVGENPQHAQHVRTVINSTWLDGSHALFDVSVLPENAVSRDLFGERTLIERQVFFEAQLAALQTERTGLLEQGWAEVVVGTRAEVFDRLFAMSEAEPEYDAATTKKLEKIDERWAKVEADIEKLDPRDEEGYRTHRGKIEALEAGAERVRSEATPEYAEATKAVGTAFLMLDAEGKVGREFRVPRPTRKQAADGNGRHGGNGNGKAEKLKPLTPADLSDGQLAATFTHECLMVREALLANAKARKRVLALILHDKVRSEALAVRQDANGTTIHATNAEEFRSAALERLRERRAAVDPLRDAVYAEDVQAYEALSAMPDGEVNKLIDVLVVEHLTAHLQRRTNLVRRLATELSIDLRKGWHPDVDWLGRYRKFQLAQLLGELLGPTYVPEHERRNKTELVDQLARLFADAADGKLEDAKLAERANLWLPANVREDAPSHGVA